VGTIFDGNELVEIQVKTLNIEDDLEQFKQLAIPLKNNTFVKLEDICEFEKVESLERLVKDDGETNFYVFANVDQLTDNSNRSFRNNSSYPISVFIMMAKRG